MGTKKNQEQPQDNATAITVNVQPSGAISTNLTAQQIKQSLILQSVELLELAVDQIDAENELAEQQKQLEVLTTAVKAEMVKQKTIATISQIKEETLVTAAATQKASTLLDRLRGKKS